MPLVSVLIWTLLCFTQGSVGQSVVVTQPAAKSVRPGQTVSIECKTNPELTKFTQGYRLQWYLQKPGESPELLIHNISTRFSGISSRFSGSGADNKIDFTLTISNVQAEDAGVYHCFAKHYVNSQYEFTQ
uniref:Ig-like domain-containing protein n=1 Tax=Sphaeramia orbicularis TaxID=375764 RepID=A0A672YSE8_9TELE